MIIKLNAPISLLPFFSKIFEKCNVRLESHLDKFDVKKKKKLDFIESNILYFMPC